MCSLAGELSSSIFSGRCCLGKMGNKPSFQLVAPKRSTGAIFNLFCPQQGSIKHKQEPLRLGECRALCELLQGLLLPVRDRDRRGGKGSVGGERRNAGEKGRDEENQSCCIRICLRKV